jgi:hypothetical protein
VAVAWTYVEVLNGAAPSPGPLRLTGGTKPSIEGDGLGTRPDVHIRTRGVWPARDTLLWRGDDESPRPRSVRFTSGQQIEVVDHRGCRYLVRFDEQAFDPQPRAPEAVGILLVRRDVQALPSSAIVQ